MEEALVGRGDLRRIHVSPDQSYSSFYERTGVSEVLLAKCVCGSAQVDTTSVINGMIVDRCSHCGIVRQRLQMTETELSEWYRTEYFKGCYQHSPEHDYAVANERLDAYRLTPGIKLLDVGAGNGAFVLAARDRSIEAWGQDLAPPPPAVEEWVYNGALADVAFPTDDFDVVVMHDVLEHFVRPLEALQEIKRVLKRPGKLIVDFPRFFHESGVHHWKWPEHLWMFTEEQLCSLIAEAGFRITNTYCPIPSKFVVEAEKLPENRPQILTPPGIGDSWWSIVKLPGFLKEHRLGLPDVWVQDS